MYHTLIKESFEVFGQHSPANCLKHGEEAVDAVLDRRSWRGGTISTWDTRPDCLNRERGGWHVSTIATKWIHTIQQGVERIVSHFVSGRV